MLSDVLDYLNKLYATLHEASSINVAGSEDRNTKKNFRQRARLGTY